MHQETLPGSAPEPRLPDGLRYLPGFLAPAEEERVRAAAAALDLQPFRMRGFVARRLVASFGRS